MVPFRLSRPGWNDYFMVLAKVAASRSTCNSRPTGCVLVKDNQVLSTGYNGPVPGHMHCFEIGGEGYCVRRASGTKNVNKQDTCIASHAEINALAMAAKSGIPVDGATLYITLNPCFVCLKAIRVAGITDIYYELLYDLNPDAAEGAYDKWVIEELGFKSCQQYVPRAETLILVNHMLEVPTSYRRKPATE
jgi:dCMP deaminase